MTREEFNKFVEDLESDSKSRSETAEEALVDFVSGIIKKFYNIRAKVAPGKPGIFGGEYSPNYGGLTNVIKVSQTHITVYYRDGYKGDVYEDTLDIKLEWLFNTEEELKKYFEECKEYRIKSIKANIEMCKNNIANYEKQLNNLKDFTYEEVV